MDAGKVNGSTVQATESNPQATEIAPVKGQGKASKGESRIASLLPATRYALTVPDEMIKSAERTTGRAIAALLPAYDLRAAARLSGDARATEIAEDVYGQALRAVKSGFSSLMKGEK